MVATIIIVVVVLVLVFAVAAALIGRETRLLAAREHRPTYRLPDAVEFVADRLEEPHTGRLSYEELAELLQMHIVLLQDQAETGVGAEAPVLTDDPGVVAVAGAAAEAGLEVPLDTVMAAMSLQLDYLKALGALEHVDDV
ncbi:MAG: hypothetical protein AAFZ07_22775 [Actinomycetota bacterium]